MYPTEKNMVTWGLELPMTTTHIILVKLQKVYIFWELIIRVLMLLLGVVFSGTFFNSFQHSYNAVDLTECDSAKNAVNIQ